MNRSKRLRRLRQQVLYHNDLARASQKDFVLRIVQKKISTTETLSSPSRKNPQSAIPKFEILVGLFLFHQGLRLEQRDARNFQEFRPPREESPFSTSTARAMKAEPFCSLNSRLFSSKSLAK